MKNRSTTTINAILKWFMILPMVALFMAIVPSCKGKVKPSEDATEVITPLAGNIDSMALRGQTIPADAPPPPPPPPPLPFNVTNGDTVWFRVDELPVFPGGSDAMTNFLGKNIEYPEAAKKKKITGRVVVGFILTKECRITDVKIIRSIDPDCDMEALRVVNLLPQFEKPAFVNGRPVAYHFVQPVHYELK